MTTHVQCTLVHLDTNEGNVGPYKAPITRVTFEEEVLTVITSLTQLADTDITCGHPAVDYPGLMAGRGIEGGTGEFADKTSSHVVEIVMAEDDVDYDHVRVVTPCVPGQVATDDPIDLDVSADGGAGHGALTL